MLSTQPLLVETDFPPLARAALETLQVNLGYRCNQQCVHCHVNAGPKRTEVMDDANVDVVLQAIDSGMATALDLTGGAPELHPRFREIVDAGVAAGLKVIDRCNLTVCEEPGQEGLAEFLASRRVEIVASLPCYLRDNVDAQRGKGTYDASVRVLKRLNALGYGRSGTGLALNLVYNPGGPFLPPPQAALEADYRKRLHEDHGIGFTALFALANMPIQRFGSWLLAKNKFDEYMALLRGAHRDENLDTVMCRNLISVDWQGFVYDCDFNQMLAIPAGLAPGRRHLRTLIGETLEGRPITVGGHCYGCTAGQGSSCGGALA